MVLNHGLENGGGDIGKRWQKLLPDAFSFVCLWRRLCTYGLDLPEQKSFGLYSMHVCWVLV